MRVKAEYCVICLAVCETQTRECDAYYERDCGDMKPSIEGDCKWAEWLDTLDGFVCDNPVVHKKLMRNYYFLE